MSRFIYCALLLACSAALAPGCGGDVSAPDVDDGQPPADGGLADEGTADVAFDDSPGEDGATPESSPDVETDSGVCATITTCPAGRGPTMVIAPCVGGGSYCIDSTEVTRAQYATFLEESFSLEGQPSFCSTKATYQPDPACSAQPEVTHAPEHPQVCIDWCDANAFCRWAGKRLCAAAWLDPNAERNEWYNACSAGGVNTYCFGSTWEPDACNGEEHGLGTTAAAGSLPTCQGGFPGLFDMTGNVSEWWDMCNDAEPAECGFGGGSFISGGVLYMPCDSGTARPASHVASTLGFRCCS